MFDPSLILIIINSIVFFLPYLIPFSGPYSSLGNFQQLGIMNKSDVNDGEWYRLFTSNFLHADFFHLFVNMYSLYNIGPTAVSMYKGFGFGLIYVISGIVGSLFSYQFGNYGMMSRGSLGASGAIMGLLGSMLAFAVFNPSAGTQSLIPQILLNLVIIGIYGFMIPQIDNWGHLGGFIAGFCVGALLVFTR
jgi:rhomboid protease GluP